MTCHELGDRIESNFRTGRLERDHSVRPASLSGCSNGCMSGREHETRSLPLRNNATVKNKQE